MNQHIRKNHENVSRIPSGNVRRVALWTAGCHQLLFFFSPKLGEFNEDSGGGRHFLEACKFKRDASFAIRDFPFKLIGWRKQYGNRRSEFRDMIFYHLPDFENADSFVLMNQNVA